MAIDRLLSSTRGIMILVLENNIIFISVVRDNIGVLPHGIADTRQVESLLPTEHIEVLSVPIHKSVGRDTM